MNPTSQTLSIEKRDEIVRDVRAYAAAEGLSDLGRIQAAARFGYEAGVAAERERAARIGEYASEPDKSEEADRD
jgi:hypothetical protein